MVLTLKTVTGYAVVLEHKEYSAVYRGGVVFGKITIPGEDNSINGFWDRFGNAVYVKNMEGDLSGFNLASLSEKDFEKIPMDDEVEEGV